MPELAHLAEHGFVVLEDVFDAAWIDTLQDAHLEMLRARGAPGLAVGELRFMVSLELRPPFLDARLYANPKLMPLIHGALGTDCVLDNVTSVVSLPRAPEQHLHKDGDLLFDVATGATLPCHALTLVVPLVDLDASTGTTALFPGTHRHASAREATGAPVLPWLRRGGCYLMDYRLSHQGTANTSARPRPILYLVYSRPWFIDHTNFRALPPLRLPAEHLSSVASEHRRLFARVVAR